MTPLSLLWLPIVLSAVAAFIVSSIIHMVIRWHQSDYRRMPGEDDVMAAIGRANIPLGEYLFPWVDGPAHMKDPDFVAKRTRGPVGMLTVLPSGMPALGGYLGKWFIYALLVSVFAAYIPSRALPPGAAAPQVFRFATTTAFLAYGFAHIQYSIWWGKPWSVTIKNLIDSFLYGAATGAVFVWLWPKG